MPAALPSPVGDLASISRSGRLWRDFYPSLFMATLYCSGCFAPIAPLLTMIFIFSITSTLPKQRSGGALLARGLAVLLAVFQSITVWFGLPGIETVQTYALVTLPLQFGVFLGVGRHLLDLTRPGTAQHKMLRRRLLPGAVLPLIFLTVATDLVFVDPSFDTVWGAALLLWTVVLGLAPWWMIRLLGTLWPLEETPQTIAQACLERLPEDLDLQITQEHGRLQIQGLYDGVPLQGELDLDRVPASLTLTMQVPTLPPGLRLRARRPEDPPEEGRLPDPILSRLLMAEVPAGVDPRILLADLHDVLLPVLHAHPHSTLADGVLTFVIEDLLATAPEPTPESMQESITRFLKWLADTINQVKPVEVTSPISAEEITDRFVQRLDEAAHMMIALRERCQQASTSPQRVGHTQPVRSSSS